jgi:type I restriction enzyme S subunit
MTTLASICELIIDCEHKTAPTVENGYPLIRTPDIGIGRLHIEGASRVDEATYDQWTKRAAPREGDLILAREAPVGNIGIIKSGVRPVLGQRTVLIRPKTDILDSGYLNYLLSSPPLRGWMIGVANGATVPHLNMSDIRSMEIPVMPSIDSQRKIASVLTDYDDLIENNSRRIKLLEEMAQRIYREWFVDFRYPGHEDARLVDSRLGPIPEDWMAKCVSDRFSVVLGGTPSRTNSHYWSNGTVPWINSGQVNRLRVIEASEMITPEALKSSSTKLMPRGTTLLAITGATLGQVSLLEIEACANQSVVGIYDEQCELAEYLYLAITNSIESIIGAATGGAQQHINQQNVKDTLIMLPSPEIGAMFRSRVQPLVALSTNLLRANQGLKVCRDLLLPRLISGQVDVSELPILSPETVA